MAWRVVAALLWALLVGGCDRAPSVAPTDSPPAQSAAGPLAASQPTALPSATTSTSSPPDVAASATRSAAALADEGSIELEATTVENAKIGRPGPGVVPVAVDPRYVLRLLVHRTDPEGSDVFAVGREVALGIHSPSRTFPGGVAKGQRLRLRLHFRRVDGGVPRYYHIEQVRQAPAR